LWYYTSVTSVTGLKQTPMGLKQNPRVFKQTPQVLN
jgi:hypothetical protein